MWGARSMAVAVLVATGARGPSAGEPDAPAPPAARVGVSSSARAALEALVASGAHPDLGRPDFRGASDALARFYAGRGGALAWLASGAPTPQARAVAGALAAADAKGLDPDDYDGPRWADRLARAPAASEGERVRLDVALSVCAARYASDVANGRVDPRRLGAALERAPRGEDPGDVLARLAVAPDAGAALAGLEPPFAAYRRTLAALARTDELARALAGAPPPVPEAVRAGAPIPDPDRLAGFLRRLGDLLAEDAGGVDALAAALRRFQERHGLDPSGRLDARTVAALRTPLARRAIQLRLTLERWRWVPRAFAGTPIVVNVPEYRLRAIDAAAHRTLSMRVIVGSGYDRRQTPLFAGELTTVILRPYWNVPSSIQRGELVPRLARDPALLARDGYDVVDRQGRVVPSEPFGERLEALRAGALRLRQRPGPRNALGLVKLVFPNVHDVYLHGTPSPELFGRARRDLSHGCIRVEDPIALAAWALRDRPEWTPERIRAATAGLETIQVKVSRPIPVLVVYGTAVVAEDGTIRFLDDVYGHDRALERALAERRALASR